jgi:hypothetical protein
MIHYREILTAIALVGFASAASADQMTDSAYIARVAKGAPKSVVAGAMIVQMQPGGTMRTIRQGSNGFTCMVMPDGTPMCADKNAMAWLNAVVTHAAPPNSTGFMYMLAGDVGASNTDPYATSPTSSNHWVKTGPHVMIVGPAAATMGYPSSADPDPTKPYVMWPGTPYAHLMLPVTPQQ